MSDLYLRRGGIYPKDAIRVESEDNYNIKFTPMHGGFVCELPVITFRQLFEELPDEPPLPPLKKCMFTIDADPDFVFEGYTRGFLWNGWQCPMFTKEVADKLMAKINDVPDIDRYYTVTWSEEDSSYTVTDITYPDESDTDEGTYVEELGCKLYSVVDGWCWDLEEIDDD